VSVNKYVCADKNKEEKDKKMLIIKEIQTVISS